MNSEVPQYIIVWLGLGSVDLRPESEIPGTVGNDIRSATGGEMLAGFLGVV